MGVSQFQRRRFFESGDGYVEVAQARSLEPFQSVTPLEAVAMELDVLRCLVLLDCPSLPPSVYPMWHGTARVSPSRSRPRALDTGSHRRPAAIR